MISSPQHTARVAASTSGAVTPGPRTPSPMTNTISGSTRGWMSSADDDRVGGRVDAAGQQAPVHGLGHLHLLLLGPRRQPELGADDPLARGDATGAAGRLDPVGVLQREVGVGLGQAGDRRPVPDGGGQHLVRGADDIVRAVLGTVGAGVGEAGPAHAGAPARAAAIWMIWSSCPPTSFCRPHSRRMSAPLTS